MNNKSGFSSVKAGSIILNLRNLTLVEKTHSRIFHHFGCDMGIRLMRKDSHIALKILDHFSLQCIPCLGVHDSFLVLKKHQNELLSTMQREYQKEMGFLPVIK